MKGRIEKIWRWNTGEEFALVIILGGGQDGAELVIAIDPESRGKLKPGMLWDFDLETCS